MACDHLDVCRHLPTMNAVIDVWMALYCTSPNHRQCARYRLSAEGGHVPITLLPNGKLFEHCMD